MTFTKGQVSWNKGKKMSPEARKKLSDSCMGRRLSDETKRKISLRIRGTKKEESNPMWKKKPTIRSLHEWVNNNIGRPKICEECGLAKNIDLANITGIYERDFLNWKYLCRKCHMISDSRLDRFMNYAHDYGSRYKKRKIKAV